jgi:hypothetical protein
MANPLGKGQSAGGWKSWTTRKKLFVLSLVLLIIIALGVGLGVGLGIGLGGGGGEGEEGSGGETTTPEGNYTTAKWQPAVGTKWQIELLHQLNDTSIDAEIYDIDLFTNNQSTIAGLQQAGRKVICYFSAGSYENWRQVRGLGSRQRPGRLARRKMAEHQLGKRAADHA